MWSLFRVILSSSFSRSFLIHFIIVYDTINYNRQLYFISVPQYRYLFERNKDSSWYLEHRDGTGLLFIVKQDYYDDDRDTVMHVDKPTMEYTRGIARGGWRE